MAVTFVFWRQKYPTGGNAGRRADLQILAMTGAAFCRRHILVGSVALPAQFMTNCLETVQFHVGHGRIMAGGAFVDDHLRVVYDPLAG